MEPQPVGAEAPWAAVVVNWEAGPLLNRCVAALLADTSAGAAPDVVVVDNASRDGSPEALLAEHPCARLVRAPANLGYAGAANLGIAATRAAVVAVLNPDTEVEPGTAGALVARLESEPRLGAVGPRILDADGSDYPSARAQPSLLDAIGHGLLGLWWRGNPFTKRYHCLDADPERARPADWVSGAAVWLRRAALDQIGGWDDRYFMYLEDVDLCWRLRRAGWEVAYEPAGEVIHLQGVTTSRRPYRMLVAHHRSAWRFARVRLTGVRRLLLPLAAVYLTLRGGLAIAVHAAAALRARRAQGR